MRRGDVVTVSELVAYLAEEGYTVSVRASKAISDCLRWEIRRGRVKRVARGCYRYAKAPATTARRVRLFAQHCQAWIVAITRSQEPPPLPPDPRFLPGYPRPGPDVPPWYNMSWIWSA